MKRTLTLALFLACMLVTKGQPLNFTITNVSGTNSITCTNPTVNLVATSSFSSAVSYTWQNGSSTLTGTNVMITAAGIYTITALSSSSITSSQTLAIYINTLTPSASLSPLTQTLSCGGSSSVNAIASPSVNITHNIFSPYGGTFTASSPTLNYATVAPGVYTYVLTENTSGCKSVSFFTITSAQGFPTFYVASPQNFILGCKSLSTCVLSCTISGTVPPGGPISFTIIGPPTSTTIPSGPLSSSSTFTVNVPGTWTIIVRDNTSLCTTKVPITIIQNTLAPNISASVPEQVLDCSTPKVVLKGFSSTQNVSFRWDWPSTAGPIFADSISININPATPNATIIANYTLTVTDNDNACISTTAIPIFQNIFPPIAKISYGGIDPCITNSVILTNISVSGIPVNGPFPVTMPVIASWYGPAPQPTAAFTSTYLAYTPGIYTITVTDLNNGCKSTTLTLNCTGLSSYENIKNEVTVFPNPGTGIYFVSIENRSSDQKIYVYNILGELLMQQTVSSEKEKIDLQNQERGIYFIAVTSNKSTIYKGRIIKQ